MAKNTILINDFRAGELTPDMDARVDLKDYYRGCRILENAMPIIEGGVARVPGTYYVRPVKTDEGWCLRVTKSGTGTGVVTSDVAGINCGSDCYVFFIEGITVVLTATADAGMSFSAWSGDGTGLVTRSLLMDGNKVVNAEFSLSVIPAFIYTAEVGGSAAAHIVKRVFSDFSESIRVSMGNIRPGGYADVKYLVGSSVPPTWNVTIPAATDNSIRAILELDPVGNALYVAVGVFDLAGLGVEKWILYKRSLTDGSVIWQYLKSFSYDYSHNITGLSYYDGNIYIIGLTDANTSKRSWAIEKRTKDNGGVWLKLAGTPAPVYDSWGGAVYADSSGVYCAIISGVAGDLKWVVQKRNLSNGEIVWEKIVAYGTIVPHKIVSFGDYIYVMGGIGSWIIEKRRKSDGVLLYYRSWAPAGGANAILNSFSINPNWPTNLQNYIRVCGNDFGGVGGAYRVRIERLLESDFSTDAFIATATKQYASGMDVDEGIGVYDSVICAVLTHNAVTGKRDIMIQRRKASDLTL